MRKIFIFIISISCLVLSYYAGGPIGCISEEPYQFGKLTVNDPELTQGLNAQTLIESTMPVADSDGNQVDTAIQITFTERIDKNTLTPETFLVSSVLGSISGEINYDEASKTATFTPDQDLALLSNYRVTLTTAVKTPKKKSLEADYTWNFSTRDGAWGEQAKEIKWSGTAAALNPQAAISNNGNAIVVWQQKDSGASSSPYSIVTRRYSVKHGWENTPDPIDNSPLDCINPQVGMDDQGRVVVVWLQADETGKSVYANSLGEKGVWYVANAKKIENIEDEVDCLGLIMDQVGNAIAFWSDKEESSTHFGVFSWGDVYINHYSLENGWEENPKLISKRTTDTFGGSQFPDIALGPDGSAMVVWEQRRFGWGGSLADLRVDSVVANHLTGSFETWNNDVIQEVEDGNEKAGLPKIASDEAGNYLVVWTERLDKEGLRNAVNARRYITNGNTWENGLTSLSINENIIEFMSLQLVMNSIGDAVAVWAQDEHIWARRYIAETGWEAAALKMDNGSGPATKPQVAIDDEGNIFATWLQDKDVWVNRYAVRVGSWDTALNIDDHDDEANSSVIAVNGHGQAIVAWERAGDIFAKMFR